MVRGGYTPVAGSYSVPIRFMQVLYGLAAEGMVINEIINQLGNDHYPGPWSTTQPDPTNQLNTYYNSDNPYNPFGNGGNYNKWVKWFLYGVGAKEVNDNINDQQPNIIVPDDNYEEIIVPYRPGYNP